MIDVLFSRSNDIVVYNCSSGFHNPLTWGRIEKDGFKSLIYYPMSDVMWYPGGGFTSNLTQHKIEVVLYHYVPAYIIDFLARLCGRPAMLVKFHSQIQSQLSYL